MKEDLKMKFEKAWRCLDYRLEANISKDRAFKIFERMSKLDTLENLVVAAENYYNIQKIKQTLNTRYFKAFENFYKEDFYKNYINISKRFLTNLEKKNSTKKSIFEIIKEEKI